MSEESRLPTEKEIAEVEKQLQREPHPDDKLFMIQRLDDGGIEFTKALTAEEARKRWKIGLIGDTDDSVIEIKEVTLAEFMKVAPQDFTLSPGFEC